MLTPYRVLSRKRAGEELDSEEIQAVVDGASDGSWTDAQLSAFLMAAAIRGLSIRETRDLTEAMLTSGEQWRLCDDVPLVGDKHSTGGVGDKVSLILSPLVAACGQPIAMLTGRGLGHTGGTTDKLESIPGLDLGLDRARTLELLSDCGLAIGMATPGIAPADRRLYALRDSTATVDSIPLVAGSILSKKLATGTAAVVFDVKVGDGAFFPDPAVAGELARTLVDTAEGCGVRSSALLTDMSQPLGRQVGHLCEVEETLACLEGRGPSDLMEVVLVLAEELGRLTGVDLGRQRLEEAISSGRARELFDRWAVLQGADRQWLSSPRFERAPHERMVEAPRGGVLRGVRNRAIGLLLIRAGAGRVRPDSEIDYGVSLELLARIGQRVEAGDELARIHLRQDDPDLVRELVDCFEIGDSGQEPELLVGTLRASP